jgi:peptidoglycan-associated lipoprotein
MKRNLAIATVMIFVCSSIFLFASCAKKQVITEEKKMEVAPKKEVAKVEPAKPAVKEAPKATAAEAEAKKALLKELGEEMARKGAAEMREAEEKKAWMERRALQFEAEGIFFDFDKSFIKEEYRPILNEKAVFLKDYPETHIRIEGNCDERGTNEYNLALGERRAESAKLYLVRLGIAPDRIETISYGEERPRAMGHDEKAWSQNRRDDFVIVNK